MSEQVTDAADDGARPSASGAAGVAGPRPAYLVGRLDRALRRHLEDGMRPHELTVAQYMTLSALRTGDGLSNAQLARRAFISPQSMNEVVKALADRQFLRRHPDPRHGRILRSELTAAGARALDECDKVVDAIEHEMLAGLSDGEREQLRSFLRSCLGRLQS